MVYITNLIYLDLWLFEHGKPHRRPRCSETHLVTTMEVAFSQSVAENGAKIIFSTIIIWMYPFSTSCWKLCWMTSLLEDDLFCALGRWVFRLESDHGWEIGGSVWCRAPRCRGALAVQGHCQRFGHAGVGQCPYYWGFVSHHLPRSVGNTISPIVGWCEPLGHGNQACQGSKSCYPDGTRPRPSKQRWHERPPKMNPLNPDFSGTSLVHVHPSPCLMVLQWFQIQSRPVKAWFSCPNSKKMGISLENVLQLPPEFQWSLDKIPKFPNFNDQWMKSSMSFKNTRRVAPNAASGRATSRACRSSCKARMAIH